MVQRTRHLQWQTGCLPRPPTLTQRYCGLACLGGLREVVISFNFHQNRLYGFQDVGVEICHFLYLRPVAYITACTTVQAVMITWTDNNTGAQFIQ